MLSLQVTVTSICKMHTFSWLSHAANQQIDPEKKKYFRIQANHLAPAGSQYSRDAVKKREHQKKVAFAFILHHS